MNRKIRKVGYKSMNEKLPITNVTNNIHPIFSIQLDSDQLFPLNVDSSDSA